MPLKTPDITTAQILAIAGAALGLVVALGVPLSDGKQHAITTLVTVLAPVLLGADAAIRHGRSRSLGLLAAAGAGPSSLYTVPVAAPTRPIAGWDPEQGEGDAEDEDDEPAEAQPEDEPEQPQEPPAQSAPKPWPEEALAR